MYTTAVVPAYTTDMRMIGQPALEVQSFYPTSSALNSDLVLIHGAGHSAQSWRVWAAYLAGQRGIRTHALSLRGHGASGLAVGQPSIRAVTIADFVADIGTFFAAMRIAPARAILACHSLGGMSGQIFAQQQRVGGLALVASVATNLMYPASLRLYRLVPGAMPQAFFRDASAIFNTLLRLKKLLLERDAEAGIAEMLLQERQPEISFIRNLKFIWPHRFRSVQTDHVLVLGGDADAIFTPRWMRKTAKLYGVEPVLIPAAPHDLMWAREPACQAGADALADFCFHVAGQ